MAVITNATTTTSLAAAIPTEVISAMVRYAVSAPYVFKAISTVQTVGPGDKYNELIQDASSAAGAYSSQSDEVTATELTPAATDITPLEYASRVFMSHLALEQSALIDMFQVAVQTVTDACLKRVDTLVIGNATGMTNSQGSNATVNDLPNFMSALSAFQASGKGSLYMPVMIMHPDAMRDLREEAATSNASILGSIAGAQLHQSVGGVNQGQFSEFSGLMIAVSERVPAGDTTGWSNFIVHVGPGENALVSNFNSRGIKVEIGPRPDRVGQDIVASMFFGTGIVEQERAYKFITRT